MNGLTTEKVRQLREKRTDAWTAMKQIWDAAGGRELTKRQLEDFDAADKIVSETTQVLNDDIYRRVYGDGAVADKSEHFATLKRELEETPATPYIATATPGDWRPSQEKAPPILSRSDSLSDWANRSGLIREEHRNLSFGKLLKGIGTGSWQGAEAERAVLAEGAGSTGGHLVPTPLSTQVIDLARNKSRVFQAGAQVVPMTSETLKMAKLATDPTASWRLENAPVGEDDLTFGALDFKARSLACLVRSSRELLEDAENVEELLRSAFAQSLALELDRVALYGDGEAPEPEGIKETSGVTLQSQGENGAAITNYTKFVDAIASLWANNHEPTGIIHSPRTETTIAKFADTTNQPLAAPAVVQAVPRYPTNQVPIDIEHGNATDASDSFVADWSNLLVGVRSEMRVLVLQERYATDMQIGFIAHLRADIQLARPNAFTVITGITP